MRNKKICPNEACDDHKKKRKHKATDLYCPICRTELVYINPEAENIPVKENVKDKLKQKWDDNKDDIKEKCKVGLGVVKEHAVSIGIGVAGVLVDEFTKDFSKNAASRARKYAKKAADLPFNKKKKS